MKIRPALIVVSSLALAVLGGEGALRLSGWMPPVSVYTEVMDPAIRYVHTPGVRVHFWKSDVAISSAGFRDREYSVERPAGTYRIFVAGECTVFGRGVSLDDSYPKVLERLLNERKPLRGIDRYEVINGGFVQYTDLQKVAFLREFGMKYRPDLVIFSHDIGAKPWIETRRSLRWFSLLRDRTPRRFLTARFLLFQVQRLLISRWAQWITLKDTEPLITERYGDTPLYRNMQVEEAFAGLKAIREGADVPILVVLHPWLNDLAEGDYRFHQAHERYRTLSTQSGLDFLDFYDSTYRNQDRRPFLLEGDPRPNPLAYRLIAEATYCKLLSLFPRASRTKGPPRSGCATGKTGGPRP